MKKQKFEVGDKICAYRGYDRCVGIVERIDKYNDVLKLNSYEYFFHFKQCRKLVKKKKPLASNAALALKELENANLENVKQINAFYEDAVKNYSVKPAPKAVARTWWIVHGNDNQWAFQERSVAKAFNKGLYGKPSDRPDIIKVREVLDEPSEEKQGYIDSAKTMRADGQ